MAEACNYRRANFGLRQKLGELHFAVEILDSAGSADKFQRLDDPTVADTKLTSAWELQMLDACEYL